MYLLLGVVVIAFGRLAFGVLALRLRCRERLEKGRQDAMVALASRLPRSGLVELDDIRGDGRHLRIRIAIEDQRERRRVRTRCS
jgi:hypothetical protein